MTVDTSAEAVERELDLLRARLAGHGAGDLSDWFGGALTWWQAWCERERAGLGRAA